MPKPKSNQLANLLQSAGIPPDAIAKILAYMKTKQEMKFNPEAKLDTTQIEDKRKVNQRWDAKSSTSGYK